MNDAQDAGVATVWALALLSVLLIVGVAASIVVVNAVERQRVAMYADVAALAAAQSSTGCAAAAHSATANGVSLKQCEIVDGDVLVTVGKALPPYLVRV